MLLSDYVPLDQELKVETRERKQEEYADVARHYFGGASSSDTVELLS